MKAFITGVLGQDGSYLSELLLDKGYEVYGMMRRISVERFDNVQHLMNHPRFRLVVGDLADQNCLNRLVKDIQPDHVYNLAAQSHVGHSFDQPIFTGDVTGLGVTRVLEAIKLFKSDAKFYQASSSEMFGKVHETPQTEKTPFHPRSPYGVAKVYGYWITVNYRESYNMFCCNGILYNHESEKRGLEFVTRKITDGVARIKLGKLDKLGLGTLSTKRDWGHARDYCEAMNLMLQQDQPDDYVIATGETHTIEEFAKLAFESVGLDYQKYIYIDPRFARPAEVDILIGDASKAKAKLGWEPKVKFPQLVKMMVQSDLKRHTKGERGDL
jgi:GDPmannose 4,6-dehydratase